jgi:hypothetical protein
VGEIKVVVFHGGGDIPPGLRFDAGANVAHIAPAKLIAPTVLGVA